MFDTFMWIKLIDVKPCGLYFEVDITVHVKLSGYALWNVLGYICHKHQNYYSCPSKMIWIEDTGTWVGYFSVDKILQ